jgi:hypothetical protein
MSFHGSAQEIRLEDGHILKANLANGDGEWNEVEIDLNNILGNNNGSYRVHFLPFHKMLTMAALQGSFEWGGENFAASAQNISFELEGDDSVPILRAELFNIDGEAVAGDINLAERIGNNNGEFHFGE